MVTCRVSKRISWTRRTCWEIFFVADCISGQFMKIWILVIFSIFFHHLQQMLIVGSPKWGWVFWGPKLVILNVWVQFSLYLNHFEQLEANISSKRLCRLLTDLSPNVKNRVHPLNETLFLSHKLYVKKKNAFFLFVPGFENFLHGLLPDNKIQNNKNNSERAKP